MPGLEAYTNWFYAGHLKELQHMLEHWRASYEDLEPQ
jgi:hypothetical protein